MDTTARIFERVDDPLPIIRRVASLRLLARDLPPIPKPFG